MRIIDKNSDFYDYLQNVYTDNSITFDRTDSFVLSKDMMCKYLHTHKKFRLEKPHTNEVQNNIMLLQVCNTFWMFLVEITEMDSFYTPKDYEIELITTWKNYDKQRELMKLDIISFSADVTWTILQGSFFTAWGYDRERIKKHLSALVQAIDTNDFRVIKSINKCDVNVGGAKYEEKHIPLLKASGLAKCINPLDIYLAFDEYFSLEISTSERDASAGITDKEKIVNHGFDTKSSFRGKRHK